MASLREPHEIDDIDAMVDYELTLPHVGDPYQFLAKCDKCGKEWHGLVRDDCPGETGMISTVPHVKPGYF
jgi:hypothetical protein